METKIDKQIEAKQKMNVKYSLRLRDNLLGQDYGYWFMRFVLLFRYRNALHRSHWNTMISPTFRQVFIK